MSRDTAPPLHPLCRRCGFAMGGKDSWSGHACKCGHYAPQIERDIEKVDAAYRAAQGPVTFACESSAPAKVPTLQCRALPGRVQPTRIALTKGRENGKAESQDLPG